MNFEEKQLDGVDTPIKVPDHYRLIDIEDGKVVYEDEKTGKKDSDEPLFMHGKDKIIFDQFRKDFPNDSVIVLLFSPENNLYLHKRASTKSWEGGKIDIASVAGARRALYGQNGFQNEEITQTAIREISEETGIKQSELDENILVNIGEFHNPMTDDYQTVFTYRLDTTLNELNSDIKNNPEVEEWFEQDYEQTLDDYFGEGVDKYAGGKKMRPLNFISDKTIQDKLAGILEK